MRRIVLALVIALSVVLPGLATSTPVQQVAQVSAHSADCYRVTIQTPYRTGGSIAYGAEFQCTHGSVYKMTVYLCGGINGNGYCGHGRSTSFDFMTYLSKYGSCTVVYSGPYWFYTGVKVQSITAWGTAGNDRWFYGNGAWLQGSC